VLFVVFILLNGYWLMDKRYWLIADSGSTKTDWLFVANDGKRLEFHTDGINPARDTRDIIYNVLYHQLLTETLSNSPLKGENNDSLPLREGGGGSVFFYGAGCIEPFSQTIRSVISELLPGCTVEVESDLLGAARALCGHEAGIACILGTGSNSCLYDGKDIVMHTPPLGYILGDEGSGSFLGKTLLNGLFKGTLSEELKQTFLSKYDLSLSGIIERVYRMPAANAFLASLVPFIAEHRTHPAIHSMLVEAFRLFIVRNIAIYGHKEMPIHCVGGIAYQFEEELHDAAASEGMKIGKILRRPIEGIVQYHLCAHQSLHFDARNVKMC
jgi:N-acetylglucosamine kinase-like BadF-type ATPase